MKFHIVLIISIFICKSVSSKEYLVSNERDFEAAVSKAKPGDNISITNGEYTGWSVDISTNGTASNPITFQAQTPGKVVFSGAYSEPVFVVKAKHTIIKGIQFNDCILSKANGKIGVLLNLLNSENCRLTACQFQRNRVMQQFMPLVIISGNGKNNTVDSCDFTGNIDCQDVQVRVTKDAFSANTLISKNVFKDKPKVSWKGGNGGECVQIGQDPVLLGTIEVKAVVRENTFINCNGEAEVISNKCSGNSYINNKLSDCDGELVMRGGHDCRIDSNSISGGKSGIRVNGSGHKILNNRISGVKTGIRLMYGAAKGKQETGFYIAASNCVIKFNKIESTETGILVGDSKNTDLTGRFDPAKYPSPLQQNIAPFENKISDNVFLNVKQTVQFN